MNNAETAEPITLKSMMDMIKREYDKADKRDIAYLKGEKIKERMIPLEEIVTAGKNNV
jgi:hypothetical protein